MTIGQSAVGPIEKIPDLKRRQRDIYWRKIGDTWEKTQLLPSDATGRELYLSKGFRLTPPSDKEPEDNTLLAENKSLKLQLQMAKAREAKAEKKETLSGSL
jgi:hypothetical protein